MHFVRQVHYYVHFMRQVRFARNSGAITLRARSGWANGGSTRRKA
jgi:hypothetical protein